MPPAEKNIVVLISARQEWQAVLDRLRPPICRRTPFGEWFEASILSHEVVFVQGGWGKVSAAAATQFAIDFWKPGLIVNLGTCGGIDGQIEKGTIVLAEKTVIYDIYEKMGDAVNAIRAYTTEIDLGWLQGKTPVPVKRGVIVSADRDLDAVDLPGLVAKYATSVGDWESGAIAYTTSRNGVDCLILRGVSDVVGEEGSHAYGNLDHFIEEATLIMRRLLASLPGWLDIWVNAKQKSP
jgi:adenosylhomocysteine nucleosidase